MKKIFIGIDFAKEKYDASIIQAEGIVECAVRQHEVFNNSVSGHRKLIRWVTKHTEEDESLWLFCGENTGGYSISLCNFLYGSGYDIWLENALKIKHNAVLQRAKSDNADSQMIAEYAMRNYDHMVLYKTPGKNIERLREAFLYRHHLVKVKASIQTRRGEKRITQEPSDVKRLISLSSKHLQTELNKAIAQYDKLIKDIIASDDELRRTFEIITSVPGMGTINAVCLIVYTQNYERFDFNSRKIACYYGVAPFGRDSGTSVHTDPHVNGFANRLIKALLTQAALASVRHCAEMRQYYDRLRKRGKKSQVALNNVKNKLLHIVTAMVRNGQKYNPDYDYRANLGVA